ncbi:MAG: ATP-binding protein [Thermoanaerobaculia bacterium]|nr:ATP-binding protein [Thermoanaerobaculia bacterium]
MIGDATRADISARNEAAAESGLPSLRARLLTGSALWGLGLLLVAGAVFVVVALRHFDDERIRDLEAHLSELESVLDATGVAPRLSRSLSHPRFRLGDSGLYWQVETCHGDVVTSPSLGSTRLRVRGAARQGKVELEPFRELKLLAVTAVVSDRKCADGHRLIVAGELRKIDGHQLVHLPTAFLLGLIGLSCLVLGTRPVARGLRSIDSLRTDLAEIRKGKESRLRGVYPKEVQPLVVDLNRLLDDQEQMTAKAAARSSDLAHALRTPLAILGNEAKRLETGAHPEIGRLLEQQLDLMHRQVEAQLASVRTVAAGPLRGQSTAIEPVFRRMASAMRTLHASRGLDLEFSVATKRTFAGRADDLEEMLGNLIDNACKWARRRVRIVARDSDGDLMICVEDDGPGVALEDRQRAFDRGQRLGAEVPGHGLGLAIVREIAELYGGDVELGDSALGGLTVLLRLPAR